MKATMTPPTKTRAHERESRFGLRKPCLRFLQGSTLPAAKALAKKTLRPPNPGLGSAPKGGRMAAALQSSFAAQLSPVTSTVGSPALWQRPRWLAPTVVFFVALLVLCPCSQALDDPAALLAQAGYAPTAEIVLTWQERAPLGQGLVHGMRVVPEAGDEAIDLYFGSDGALLDANALAALGVKQKNWQWRAVSRPPETPSRSRKTVMHAPVPRGPMLGLPLEERLLPQPDVAKALNEDAAGLSTPAKGVLRTGVFQDFGLPIEVDAVGATDGAWVDTANGGRLWSAAVTSPGALGQRLHFAAISLPPDAVLLVYDIDEPSEVYGPFRTAQDFWAPTCFAECVAIECYLPRGSAPRALSLIIDDSIHQYRYPSPTSLKEGNCHVEAACEAAWLDVASAVGGIGTIGDTGSLWCTGALIADAVENTQTPYIWTADHCVGSQLTASSIELYWLYQTSECGGDVPRASSVPRTSGGADYLAGSSGDAGTDFTLLQLRQQPPAELAFAGYSTEAACVGTAVTCIHHPSGAHKRISFGTITDDGSPLYGFRLDPIERFHEVLWHTATTEPGSSGSPLFEGQGLIVGQLFGGLASCSAPEEPDYYGRFDVAYPLVAEWLGSPTAPQDEYDLTIGIQGAGGVRLNSDTIVMEQETFRFESGSVVRLMANAMPNWIFARWEGDGVDDTAGALLQLTMNRNWVVDAVFRDPSVEEGEAEPDGEAPVEGSPSYEGETQPEGDPQNEGEAQTEGEPQTDGEPAEGEGGTPSDGEAPREGEAEEEGESSEGEAETPKPPVFKFPGCGAGNTGGDGALSLADVLLLLGMATLLARHKGCPAAQRHR